MIAALVEKAKANPTPLVAVVALEKSRDQGQKRTMMHDEFTMLIPLNYMVTFTHEEQRQCVCRHISVSLVDRPGRAPAPVTIDCLLGEFGFVNRFGALAMWTTQDGDTTIVEAVEPLDGDMAQLRRKN